MTVSIKTLQRAFLAVALCTTAISSAQNEYHCNDDSSMPIYSGPVGNFHIITEALIFKACEDGLAYGTGTTLVLPNPAQPDTFVNSRLKNIHPEWDVGFRLGLGYTLPCDCWGIEVLWTHFQTHAHSSFNRPFADPGRSETSGAFFTPGYGFTDLNQSDLEGIDRTKARWKLHLDLVDVEFGRFVCLSECLTIRPHIGVRAAWINQSFRIVNSVDALDLGLSGEIQNVRLKGDYEGVGLRGGLDTLWNLGCGFSLYGNAAGSVLYGNYNVKSENNYRFFIDSPVLDIVEQKDDFCACRAATDAVLGVRWRSCFCEDTVALTFQIAWEHHLFFNQNPFEDFVLLVCEGIEFDPDSGDAKNTQNYRGNLCLKGISLSAMLDF